MLKKIPTQQLRTGMYVQEVCGSWMDHPFWRSSFLLSSGKQLAQLQAGAVKEVVIDTDKGLDVLAEGSKPEVPSAVVPEPAADSPQPVPTPPHPPQPEPLRPAAFEEEVVRANRIVQQARGQMKSMFEDARLGKAVDAEHCLPLVDDITQSVSRNPGAIVSLARLKTSDDYTYMHSVAVCALMVALARQLGFNEADTREAGMAGLVHDLGKAMMPPEVLNKPGKLTEAEFATMKAHPQAGYDMLKEARGVGEVPMDVCLHHHEKVNGKGYPHGLVGDDISIYSRMGAVCDVYDAITSNRPYKAGWDPSESLQKMAQWAQEGHFDPRVFQAFVKSIGIYPTGSLVRLKSGKLAVVVVQGGQSLLQPTVKAFFSTRSNEPIPPEVIDLSKSNDQIESRESPGHWGFRMLDEYWLTP